MVAEELLWHLLESWYVVNVWLTYGWRCMITLSGVRLSRRIHLDLLLNTQERAHVSRPPPRYLYIGISVVEHGHIQTLPRANKDYLQRGVIASKRLLPVVE